MEPSFTNISPLDGRYQQQTVKLRAHVSETGFMRARVEVEIEWLITLSQHSALQELPNFSDTQLQQLRALYLNFDAPAMQAIKDIEKTTNHDVKAVEYWLQSQCQQLQLEHVIPFIHFACTSEDINNLSHGLMTRSARAQVLAPAMDQLINELAKLAEQHKSLSMLSRTHGQTASPTTLGKELAVFVYRLDRQRQQICKQEILGKFNGAVGNYNAHLSVYPDVDWAQVSAQFIEGLGLKPNPHTTQIESHDWMAELFQAMMRFNQILLNLCRDIWSYISNGYFTQKRVENEVGSSTMPHKVNPIDFENAEGNLGMANAMLAHMADKLAVSRWQRDLSDSTVLRNLGVGMGYSFLAYSSALKGLGKLQANPKAIAKDLDQAWEVLTEAVQTMMRRYSLDNPYEQLKALSRGKPVDQTSLQDFIQTLDIPQTAKQRLLELTPGSYIGNAPAQVTQLSARLSETD